MTNQQIIRAILDAATEGDLVKAEKVLEDYAEDKIKQAYKDGQETEVERLKENEARHLNAIREAMRTIEKYTSLNGATPCGNHVYNDLRQHLAATNNL